MSRSTAFIRMVKSEFPDDRLTYQKSVATFHPESAAEASQFLKLANKHEQKTFISGFGNNLEPVGELFESVVVIHTDRLNSLMEVSPADFYVKTGSGYPLQEVNADIQSQNLFLPHSALPYVGSVGGAVSINLTAELNGHDFPIKKYFIQTEVVTPEGQIIKPGSTSFKSVSGYDIVKIFAPSWGLLGLVVSATFRVLPTSAIEEFAGMVMKPIDRDSFLAGLEDSNQSTDAVYCRKIKARFDPRGILPAM